jgi:hypothetical protein
MVWRGATSPDWNTASNWYTFNGTNYTVASVVPNGGNRVIIPANQTCVFTQPAVNVTTAGAAKDVIIESGATLTMTTGNLNVSGNFVNNGTFASGSGTVSFNTSAIVSGGATTFNNVTISSTWSNTGHFKIFNPGGQLPRLRQALRGQLRIQLALNTLL